MLPCCAVGAATAYDVRRCDAKIRAETATTSTTPHHPVGPLLSHSHSRHTFTLSPPLSCGCTALSRPNNLRAPKSGLELPPPVVCNCNCAPQPPVAVVAREAAVASECAVARAPPPSPPPPHAICVRLSIWTAATGTGICGPPTLGPFLRSTSRQAELSAVALPVPAAKASMALSIPRSETARPMEAEPAAWASEMEETITPIHCFPREGPSRSRDRGPQQVTAPALQLSNRTKMGQSDQAAAPPPKAEAPVPASSTAVAAAACGGSAGSAGGGDTESC
mmetsp:Transcript_9935/g.32866  ORF Transcript_9935/g.32866 Transcript_9935/m.32866 type:complete len:279 (-) Transcript_9935:165-1001(-)